LLRARGGGRVRPGGPVRRVNRADGDAEAALAGEFRGAGGPVAPVRLAAVLTERKAHPVRGAGEVRQGDHRGRVAGDRDQLVERARPGDVEGKVDRPEIADPASQAGTVADRKSAQAGEEGVTGGTPGADHAGAAGRR
jgi:hypothetical protein